MNAAGDTQSGDFIRLALKTGPGSASTSRMPASDHHAPALTASCPSTSSRPAQLLACATSPDTNAANPARATEPLLEVCETDRQALAAILPLDLWKRILGHVDESSLVQAERVSRGMVWLARQIERAALDPALEPWRSQVQDCENTLASLVGLRYPLALRRSDGLDVEQARWQELAGKYELALKRLASCYRCLAFQVLPGRTEAVCNALSGARAWQLAVMTVANQVKENFLAVLESALRARGARRELHLRLASTACMENYNAASPALRLTRLHLLSDLRGTLQPLQFMLAGENGITHLSMVSNSKHARTLVEALAKGSHALQVLYLFQYASPQLPATLARKPALRELGLGDCRLRGKGLTLAALLLAAPGLQTLHLGAVKFEAGSTTGCAAAMKASRLHTIKLLRCPLFMVDRHQGGDTPQLSSDDPEAHAQLQQGLAEAPCLRELCLAGLGNKGELFVLEAFAHNPGARTVRVMDIKDGAQAATDAVRAIREDLKLAPLTFVYHSASSDT